MNPFEGINDAVEALFAIPNVALWLATGLLGWCAGIVLVNRIRQYGPLVARLDERLDATAFVEAAATDTEARAAFADAFGEVDAAMMAGGRQAAGLRHAWSQFRGGLLDPDERPLRATASPADYFAGIGDGTRILAWWANIFVAVGLSFTFLGIVAALLSAVRAMGASADPTTMQHALIGLLHITAAKFWTSIGGVVSSIVLRVFDRRWSAAIGRRLERLCERLERGTVFTTPQQLAYAQLRLIEARPERRGEAAAAPSGMADLAPLLGALVGRIETLQGGSPAPAGGADDLAAAARELREAATRIADALGSAGRSQAAAARVADAGAATLADAAGEVGTMLTTLARVAGEMATIAAPLRDGVQRLGTVAGALEEAARLVDRRNARAEEAMARLTAALEQTSAAAARAFESYRERFEAVDAALGHALEAIGSASADHAAALTAQVAQIDTALGGAVDRLGVSLNVIGDLAAALDDMRGEMRARR